ncbi:hypothetical protein SDC9_116034 [bioreactor metagenome]|uniref:Uncharacterized protein n=1 Tax=bioreactor metagenome TaxID=1076179 RepID=A0A645BUH0_9ZZZZ
MYDGRRIVPCIFSCKDRIHHNRFAQIAVSVALSDPLVDCFVKAAAYDPGILPDLNKKDGKACILANRHMIAFGDFYILQYITENFFSQWRYFFFNSLFQLFCHVVGKIVICIDT